MDLQGYFGLFVSALKISFPRNGDFGSKRPVRMPAGRQDRKIVNTPIGANQCDGRISSQPRKCGVTAARIKTRPLPFDKRQELSGPTASLRPIDFKAKAAPYKMRRRAIGADDHAGIMQGRLEVT